MPKITTADDKLQGKGRSNIEKMKKTKKKQKTEKSWRSQLRQCRPYWRYLSTALDRLKDLYHVQSINSREHNIYLPFVQVFRSSQHYPWFPAKSCNKGCSQKQMLTLHIAYYSVKIISFNVNWRVYTSTETWKQQQQYEKEVNEKKREAANCGSVNFLVDIWVLSQIYMFCNSQLSKRQMQFFHNIC